MASMANEEEGDPGGTSYPRDKRAGSPLERDEMPKKERSEFSLLLNEICADIFPMEEVKDDTKAALKRLRSLIEEKKETKDFGTQTDERNIREAVAAQEIVKMIEEAGEDTTKREELIKREWPSGAFCKTETTREYIEVLKEGRPMVLLVEK